MLRGAGQTMKGGEEELAEIRGTTEWHYLTVSHGAHLIQRLLVRVVEASSWRGKESAMTWRPPVVCDSNHHFDRAPGRGKPIREPIKDDPATEGGETPGLKLQPTTVRAVEGARWGRLATLSAVDAACDWSSTCDSAGAPLPPSSSHSPPFSRPGTMHGYIGLLTMCPTRLLWLCMHGTWSMDTLPCRRRGRERECVRCRQKSPAGAVPRTRLAASGFWLTELVFGWSRARLEGVDGGLSWSFSIRGREDWSPP